MTWLTEVWKMEVNYDLDKHDLIFNTNAQNGRKSTEPDLKTATSHARESFSNKISLTHISSCLLRSRRLGSSRNALPPGGESALGDEPKQRLRRRLHLFL